MRDCQNEDGAWNDDARRAKRCSRIDLPPVDWDVDVRALYSGQLKRGRGIYHGRYPDKTIDDLDGIGIGWPEDYPPESPDDGCPRGPAMGPFAASVMVYARRRTRDGGRVPNRFLDEQATPWQVWEAVYYLEEEQERWHAYCDEVDRQRWLRKLPQK